MTSIFDIDNNNSDEFNDKINLDELYQKKQQYDLNKLNLFNKILARIHKRIKVISRQTVDQQHCWFVVPEMIIGVPKYDQASCIAYLIDKLKDNQFMVKYYHPNTLHISWAHWVPSYVRAEIKKKMGIEVDEFGRRIIDEEPDEDDIFMMKPVQTKSSQQQSQQLQDPKKTYTAIDSYKPSGYFR